MIFALKNISELPTASLIDIIEKYFFIKTIFELKMKVLTCSKTRELSNMYSNIPDRPLSQHLESVSVGKTSVQKIIILTYTVSYNTNPVMEKACGLTISIPVPLVEPIL